MSAVALYSRSERGHRAAFLRFFSALVGGERITARDVPGARQTVVFLQIEEGFGFYVAAALWRAMVGRRTVGLLFRPLPALRGRGARLTIKRWTLKALRTVPTIETLALVPFEIEPGLAQIADGWIDDPQQWDLTPDERASAAAMTDLATRIRHAANGRRIVAAMGTQSAEKGFAGLVEAYAASPELRGRYLFVAVGRLDAALAAHGERFVALGGMLEDRQISDEELLSVYGVCDFAWCHYAECYDQSSGIMGRAAQLGVPAIVRDGSLLERICRREGIAHLRPGDLLGDDALPGRDAARGLELAQLFAARSSNRIAAAIEGRR